VEKVTDTSPDAERILIEACRKMTPARKWRQMGEIYHTARTLHAAGVKFRNPQASAQDILEAWTAVTLGESLARVVREARNGDGLYR
jgi:hypothetical protein